MNKLNIDFKEHGFTPTPEEQLYFGCDEEWIINTRNLETIYGGSIRCVVVQGYVICYIGQDSDDVESYAVLIKDENHFRTLLQMLNIISKG